MFIVKHRSVFFTLSAVIILASVFAMFTYGFNFGIDFKGGSILEVQYLQSRPNIDVVKAGVASSGLENFLVSPVGETNYSIKARVLNQDEKNAVIATLSSKGDVQLKEVQFSSIGPSVGKELANKAYTAIAVVVVCIMLFIMFAFRKLKNPLNYGIATVIALAHDVIIPTGIYVSWIHITHGEIDLLFVTALLAILGYSVHDTIVVFDRVRENLLKKGGDAKGSAFEEIVGSSINQTFGRSINTSLTIFLVLLALYFVGGETTHNFAFVLLVGVVAGTYSSIFVASPLLVTLEGLRHKK